MKNELEAIAKFVYHKVMIISESENEGAIKAMLARLRRGLGKPPGSLPEIWYLTIEGLPEPYKARTDEPSYTEWATHTALTLFALHQQGKDVHSDLVHESGRSLGEAIRKLVLLDKDKEEAVTRRFQIAATSDEIEELVWHLRGLVQLLRTKDIKLDYVSLAKDLYRFQFASLRDRVRMDWGRSFYRQIQEETEGDN